MTHDLKEVSAKLVALDLWEIMLPFNWALKPQGTAFPYFCTVVKGDDQPVRARLMFLEGWQTLHDYVRTRIDSNFGFYSSPLEMPHFELLVLANGEHRLYRHDPGFMPQEVNAENARFLGKLLWETYGIMLRVESDRQLLLKFAEEKSIFARVEDKSGQWSDQPLAIADPPPYSEQVVFDQRDLKQSRDLPIVNDFILALDFRLVPNLMTQEKRPRMVYRLWAVDVRTKEKVIDLNISMHPESGLRGLWEGMPTQVLKEFVRLGKVPGEIRLVSGRVFRLMRPLCMELPFKLSLHDKLEEL